MKREDGKEKIEELFRRKVAARLEAVDEELRSIRYSLADKHGTHPLQDLLLSNQMQISVAINYLFHLTRREEYLETIQNLRSQVFRNELEEKGEKK